MSDKESLEFHKSEILTLDESNKSAREIADALYATYGKLVSKRTVQRKLKEWRGSKRSDLSQPVTDIQGDKAELVSDIRREASDATKLIKERGLDPQDWEIERLRINKWGFPGNEQEQLTLQLVRNKPVDIVLPARADGYKFNPTRRNYEKESHLVVFVGDQQAPFQDKVLHECFLQFLTDEKPERGVLLGDTIDLNDISRHRKNPDQSSSVQKCLNEGYRLLRDYVEASHDTEWEKLAGNHDERLRNLFIDKLMDFYGTTRANTGDPESPVHSVEFLLRLDELGIRYIDPKGAYDQAQVNIGPYLAARHGWIAKQGAGVTALKSLETLGYSIIVGHTHRQAIVRKTIHDINGKTRNIVGVEAGCMCNIGLGYSTAEDWTQGFVTASVQPNGKFHIDLATFEDGVLYWRDRTYS